MLKKLTIKALNSIENEPRRQVEKNIEEKLNPKQLSNNHTPPTTSDNNRPTYNNNPRAYRKLPYTGNLRPTFSDLRSTCFRTSTEPSISFLPGKNDDFIKKLFSRCKTSYRGPSSPISATTSSSRVSKRDSITHRTSKKHTKKSREHHKKEHHRRRDHKPPSPHLEEEREKPEKPENQKLPEMEKEWEMKDRVEPTNQQKTKENQQEPARPVLEGNNHNQPAAILVKLNSPVIESEAISDEEIDVFEDLVDGLLPPSFMDQ